MDLDYLMYLVGRAPYHVLLASACLLASSVICIWLLASCRYRENWLEFIGLSCWTIGAPTLALVFLERHNATGPGFFNSLGLFFFLLGTMQKALQGNK